MGDQIDALEATADTWAEAVRAEGELALARAEHEAALVNSLIGEPNPMTGKPHSASSAALAAEQDEHTLTLRRRRLDAEAAVIRARAAYRAAELRAQYALAALTLREG